MNLLGTLVNTGAVLLGGGIGLLAQKGLPKRLSDILFQALGGGVCHGKPAFLRRGDVYRGGVAKRAFRQP